MSNEIWPPPPSSPTPETLAEKTVSKTQYRFGIASLVLSVVGVLIIVGMIVIAVRDRMSGEPLQSALVGIYILVGTALESIGLVVGVFGWKTAAGKVGLVLSFVGIIIPILLYIIGTSGRHG